MVYRFRVVFEDYEEVYRDIDIKSSQTFYDFHTILLSSINFEDNCEASFFTSDDMWRKGDEIALNPPKEETDNKSRKKVAPPKYTMKKCKLAALIDDPHQKFIYVSDPNTTAWTFMIELKTIVPDNEKVKYPTCSKTVGIAPKKVKAPIVLPDVLDDEFEEVDELDEKHETEAYKHSTEELGIDEDLDEVGIAEEESEGEEDVLEEDADMGEFEGGEESLLDEE